MGDFGDHPTLHHGFHLLSSLDESNLEIITSFDLSHRTLSMRSEKKMFILMIIDTILIDVYRFV
jgi:hypothetical protein